MTEDLTPPTPPQFIKWIASTWAWWMVRVHGTKIIGFAGATISVFSAATNLLTPRQLQITLLLSGLLTAWRGFLNSKQ